jgi:hypothetical protein
MILWISVGLLIPLSVGACTRAAAGGDALVAVGLSQLTVTSGVVRPAGAAGLALRSATIRAVVTRGAGSEAEAAFVYQGPSQDMAPLASGEVRRQFGLKLRARDTCNVVYVMWHIEPTSGIHVSVKSNPGKTEHSQCGDQGYLNVAPSWWRRDLPNIRAGERRVLRASIDARELRVTVDGAPAWVGTLPPEALTFDGPAGMRSDNGDFDVELRSAPGSQSSR